MYELHVRYVPLHSKWSIRAVEIQGKAMFPKLLPATEIPKASERYL